MTETSLRTRQAWKSGTESWIVNQNKTTQKFLCSIPWPLPKACVEGLWMVSQLSVPVCCSCHVSLFNRCDSGREYLKSHLVLLDGFPEASQMAINFSQV